SNGLAVGVVAALAGSLIGFTSWLFVVPLLERATAHRIDPLHFPWWLLLAASALAILAATLAAWVPAREIARIPTVRAISGQPLRTTVAKEGSHRWLPLLVVSAASFSMVQVVGGWLSVIVAVGGVVALVMCVVAIGEPAIRLFARVVSRSRVAVRLAARDLVRNRAKSVGALAAITLALGVAAAIVVGTSATLFASSEEGNLADNQLMVRVGEIPPSGDVAPIPDRSNQEIADLEKAVGQIAVSLDADDVTAIDVAIAPDAEGFGGLPSVALTREVEPGLNQILTFVYIANPPLLDHYQVDLGNLGESIEVLTIEEGRLFFEPMRPELVENPVRLDARYTSLPSTFILRKV
ncbi:MAG: hypothetical protein ACRDU7_10970, partial [Acidimicrobiia bacterium]